MSRRQPLVSSRVSIAWSSEFRHHEPTDTLVITGSSYFLDFRVLKGETGTSEVTLDWAIAGTKENLPDEDGFSKAKWVHILNSRKSFTTDVPSHDDSDVGSMITLDDGNVKETGSMFNPEHGKVMEYEEIWRDLFVDPNSPVCILESDEPGEITNTFVGRVGRWQIGFRMVYDGTRSFCSGWREDQDSTGNWRRLYEVQEGGYDLPPRLPDDLGACCWEESHTIEWNQTRWKVREFFWTSRS